MKKIYVFIPVMIPMSPVGDELLSYQLNKHEQLDNKRNRPAAFSFAFKTP